MTSKSQRVRNLLEVRSLNRAQIAREVGCSYQEVRNIESRWLNSHLPPYDTRDPIGPSPVGDCTLTLPSREVMLHEERPIKYTD